MFEPETLPPNCEFIKGNLLNLPELERAIENCKLVFHSASAGLSGPGQLNKEICFSVNVDGTQLVYKKWPRTSTLSEPWPALYLI